MDKVVFVTWTLEFGGLEIVLLDWLGGIDTSKVSATLCTRSRVLADKVASKKLPIEITKLNMADGEPFWRSFGKWVQLWRSIRPDKIIFLEAGIGEFSLAALLAGWFLTAGNVFLFEGVALGSRLQSRKKRLHYGFLPGLGLYRYKQILKHRIRGRLPRHIFVASRGLKDNLSAYFGYPLARMSVLHHGVDIQRFQPSPTERVEFRRLHRIPDDAVVLVSHGRLARVKRIDRTLRVFKVLCGEHPNLWLLMTAYGPLKDEVEKIVGSSAAYSHVKLAGFQEDPSSILKASDIYVLASDDEGFGIALVEAMATGLVCVATNGVGPLDILVNGENGILVGATDDGVLAGLRRALSLNEEERTRLVEQARNTVENRFKLVEAIHTALRSMEVPTTNTNST